jgi:hypothetical protein
LTSGSLRLLPGPASTLRLEAPGDALPQEARWFFGRLELFNPQQGSRWL